MTLTERYLKLIEPLQVDKTLPVYFHEFMLIMKNLCEEIDEELNNIEENASTETADVAKQVEVLEERLDRI